MIKSEVNFSVEKIASCKFLNLCSMETAVGDDANNTNSSARSSASAEDHTKYFEPFLRALVERDESTKILQSRVDKACRFLEEGLPLYPNDFIKNMDVSEFVEAYSSHSAEELQALLEDLTQENLRLAGRIISFRSFGKVSFFHIQDVTGRIQVFASRDSLGKEAYARLKALDVGDIVGVEGRPFLTKTGELTVFSTSVRLLTKSLRPLPEKWHGLKDVETRYRRRYVDLIVTPRVKEIFLARTAIIRGIRSFLDARGFIEVETPVLQAIPGGAAAKPFITLHNALDTELYMRIAPELYLKRLLVGGLEKVYEIGRQFRNEGISTRHNPEFTMCEFYWAFARFEDLMDLTEELFAKLAADITGSSKIIYAEQEIDLSVGTWKRVSYFQALEEIGGISPDVYNDYEAAVDLARKSGEKVLAGEKLGKIQAKLFDIFVEDKLVQPHFIYAYPTDISPLSRRNDENPLITDRFELFIAGREMCNAFSELNDPVEQRRSFEEQVKEKVAGDEEAHQMDEDYIRALEYGMPPAAGQGIGVDRLVMLLTNSPSIREVILFPLLKPETTRT